MKKLLITLVAIVGLLTTNLYSQSFTNQTSLLNPVPGNSNQPCVVDMNGDGLDDVVRTNGNSLYIDYQQPNGTFNQITYEVAMSNFASWSIAAGDIDGNGYMDLCIGGGSKVSFLYANDDGTGYTEVLFDDYIFSQRSNFVDIDNDGNLDAFVCHDVDQSHPYRNDGNGVLSEDQTLIETLPIGGNYASIWVDFDHDNDLDLHIAKCRAGAAPSDLKRMNGLYRNNGDGTFTEMAAEVGLDDNDQSWVTVFEDFDNDGDFDAFTVNHAWANILYENDGSGNFTQITTGSGINASDLGSWACIGADFDNDGFVDLLTESTTNEEMYHNNGNMTFTSEDMPFDDGALCDLNNDGFIDVFTGNTLWINDGNENNWIKFNLTGIISNLNAIGTKIKIYGDWGVQIRESRSGESFNPMSSLDIFFGLGSATSVDYVEVIWPSGMVTTVDNPQINSTVDLIEAECLFDTEDIVAEDDLELCPGEEVTLTAPAGYTYSWNQDQGSSQSITVNEAGNYHVIMSQTGSDCISISNSIVVSMIPMTEPTITFDGSTTMCASSPITLEASEGLSYNWSTNEDSPSIVVNQTGTYSVSVENQCGSLTSEELDLEFLSVPNPVVTSNTTIAISGDLLIEAEGEDIIWYGDAEGTDVLGTGNSINLNIMDSQSIYMQSSQSFGGALQEGGKPDFAGGGGLPSTGGGSTFNVWEEFTLLSVRVNALTPGERTITLVDENENVLETFTGNMDGVDTIELNWVIPVGENFQLLCEENNLFRNNSGVSYPYAIGDVGELHTSTWGGQYYYFFYDWQIQKNEMICYSDLVEVGITVGINEINQVSGIEIFPNPSTDFVTLSLNLTEDLDLSIEVLNSLGQKVIEKTLGTVPTGSYRETINVSELATGSYTIVVSNQGRKNTYSIVVD